MSFGCGVCYSDQNLADELAVWNCRVPKLQELILCDRPAWAELGVVHNDLIVDYPDEKGIVPGTGLGVGSVIDDDPDRIPQAAFQDWPRVADLNDHRVKTAPKSVECERLSAGTPLAPGFHSPDSLPNLFLRTLEAVRPIDHAQRGCTAGPFVELSFIGHFIDRAVTAHGMTVTSVWLGATCTPGGTLALLPPF